MIPICTIIQKEPRHYPTTILVCFKDLRVGDRFVIPADSNSRWFIKTEVMHLNHSYHARNSYTIVAIDNNGMAFDSDQIDGYTPILQIYDE